MAADQYAWYIGLMLGQCWPTVYDGGPALAQHRAIVSCLLAGSTSYGGVGEENNAENTHHIFK